MKRGWITWDKADLPPSAFETRLNVIQKSLAEKQLPAAVVYADVWKSNRARHFSNLMPYWNRALLVIPRDAAPILICGLSPRVYPWIRSVTILDEIRPGANLGAQLLQMCLEKSWPKIGVLDLNQLPNDLFTPISAEIETVDLPSSTLDLSCPDGCELAMHRHAAKMTRELLEEELLKPCEGADYQLAGRLERTFRRAGVEDLVVLFATGKTPPSPASGAMLHGDFSVALAVEYRGHWVKIARPRTDPARLAAIRAEFDAARASLDSGGNGSICETLSGPYPYEAQEPRSIAPGSILTLHVESPTPAGRLFFGDTCVRGASGAELL